MSNGIAKILGIGAFGYIVYEGVKFTRTASAVNNLVFNFERVQNVKIQTQGIYSKLTGDLVLKITNPSGKDINITQLFVDLKKTDGITFMQIRDTSGIKITGRQVTLYTIKVSVKLTNLFVTVFGDVIADLFKKKDKSATAKTTFLNKVVTALPKELLAEGTVRVEGIPAAFPFSQTIPVITN